MNPQHRDYKTLFKVQGKLSCLHGEILVSGPLGLGHPICLYHGEHWDTYMALEGEKRCNAKGAEILGEVASYREYAAAFREYIADAQQNIIPKFQEAPKRLSLQDFEDMFASFHRFWYFYGITDFPYSEGMYQRYEAIKDPALKEATEDFGKLKFEGRDILNAYMHDNGVVANLLRGVAGTTGVDQSLGQFLFSDDIRALLKGEQVDMSVIEARSEFYGCGYDGTFHVFSRVESERLWNDFHPAMAETKEIKGTIAYKGLVRGRVTIAPMLTDPEAIAQVVAKMNDGDVLVAESTTPELLLLCKKASAIVTDQGGMLSHAAVVSREMKKPCVIGTLRATQVLKDGDMVEVDADNGVVRKI